MSLYQHDHGDRYRLEIRGALDAAVLVELEACWATARATLGGRKAVIDLNGVSTWQTGCLEDLRRYEREGLELVGTTAGVATLLTEIRGATTVTDTAGAPEAHGSDKVRGWFRPRVSARA